MPRIVSAKYANESFLVKPASWLDACTRVSIMLVTSFALSRLKKSLALIPDVPILQISNLEPPHLEIANLD